jgi:hypothetical protein
MMERSRFLSGGSYSGDPCNDTGGGFAGILSDTEDPEIKIDYDFSRAIWIKDATGVVFGHCQNGVSQVFGSVPISCSFPPPQ